MTLIMFPKIRPVSASLRNVSDIIKQAASVKRFERLSHHKTGIELLTSEAAGADDYALICAADDWATEFANEISKKRKALANYRRNRGEDW